MAATASDPIGEAVLRKRPRSPLCGVQRPAEQPIAPTRRPSRRAASTDSSSARRPVRNSPLKSVVQVPFGAVICVKRTAHHRPPRTTPAGDRQARPGQVLAHRRSARPRGDGRVLRRGQRQQFSRPPGGHPPVYAGPRGSRRVAARSRPDCGGDARPVRQLATPRSGRPADPLVARLPANPVTARRARSL